MQLDYIPYQNGFTYRILNVFSRRYGAATYINIAAILSADEVFLLDIAAILSPGKKKNVLVAFL